MSALYTQDDVYRRADSGAFYDDDSFRIDEPEDNENSTLTAPE